MHPICTVHFLVYALCWTICTQVSYLTQFIPHTSFQVSISLSVESKDLKLFFNSLKSLNFLSRVVNFLSSTKSLLHVSHMPIRYMIENCFLWMHQYNYLGCVPASEMLLPVPISKILWVQKL